MNTIPSEILEVVIEARKRQANNEVTHNLPFKLGKNFDMTKVGAFDLNSSFDIAEKPTIAFEFDENGEAHFIE